MTRDLRNGVDTRIDHAGLRDDDILVDRMKMIFL